MIELTKTSSKSSPTRRLNLAGLGLPLGWWAVVLGVMVAEILWLSLRFDARQMGAVDSVSWYAWPLANASAIFRGLVVLIAVTAVLGGKQLVRELSDRFQSAAFPAASLSLLVANLASFVSFFGLSTLVLDGGLHDLRLQAVWFASWLLAGLATLGFAAAAMIPASWWWSLLRAQSAAVAAGLAAAVVATIAGQSSSAMWAPLADATFRVVVALLRLAVPEVVSIPSEMVVGTPTFRVVVAPVCSGFEGIGMTLALLAGYLWYDRANLRFPRALALVPLGVAAIWICNCIRIAVLVLIGAWGYPSVAIGGFHSQAGWLAFNAVGLGTIALARMPVFRQIRTSDSLETSTNPVAPYVIPLMVLMLTLMVVTALSPSGGFDLAYPIRVLTVGLAFWCLRRRYAEPLWSWSWTAPAIGVLVFALWLGLEPVQGTSADPSQSPWRLPRGLAVCWLIFRVVGSVVTVPMAEELAFRGFLLRRLVAADFESVPARRFSWLSFVGSSVLFGAMHGRFLAGTLAGAAYALAVYRRGRLSDAVVAHATTNALIAGYVIITGNWSLWS